MKQENQKKDRYIKLLPVWESEYTTSEEVHLSIDSIAKDVPDSILHEENFPCAFLSENEG